MASGGAHVAMLTTLEMGRDVIGRLGLGCIVRNGFVGVLVPCREIILSFIIIMLFLSIFPVHT